MKRFPALVAGVAVTLSGCGRSPGGDTMLFMVNGDTVTVAEAGAYWDSLEPDVRLAFSTGENPVGRFILAYARRVLVEREINRLGLLDLPAIDYRTRAWQRLQSSRAVDAATRQQAFDAVSEEEITFYLGHLGRTVWYTSTVDGDARIHGPVTLSELPPETGMVLAGLEQGETAAGPEGTRLTLDSTISTDRALVDAMLADSASTVAFGRNRIAQQRAAATIDSLRTALWEEAEPDFRSRAFLRFSGLVAMGTNPASSDTLIVSRTGVWTAERMVEEIRLEAESSPVQPSDTTWLRAFASVLVNRENLASLLERADPAAFTEIHSGAGTYRMRLAADTLYRMNVSDSIVITGQMLDSAYAISSASIPERRVVECVVLRDTAQIMTFKQAVSSDAAPGWIDGLEGLPSLASSEVSPRITRPLAVDEVPADLGDSVFATSDTLKWFGPAPFAPLEAWLAVRLISIRPQHEASFEEALPALDTEIRASMEQILFERWMNRLESSYGLEINESAITRLPSDPSEWTGL